MLITWFLKHWCEAWWDYLPCYTWLTQKQRFINHFSKLEKVIQQHGHPVTFSLLQGGREGSPQQFTTQPQSTNPPRQGWGTAEDEQNSSFLIWHRKFCWAQTVINSVLSSATAAAAAPVALWVHFAPQGPQFSLIQPQKILDSPSGGISIGAGSVLRERAVASPGTESNSGPSSVCARISAESKICHSFLWGLLVLCAGSQKWKTSVFLLWPVRNLGLIMDISLLSSLLLSSAPWWWAKGCREKLWVTFRFSLDREEMTVEVGRKSSHPESWGWNLHISKGLFMEDYAFSSMIKAKSGSSSPSGIGSRDMKKLHPLFLFEPYKPSVSLS